MYKAVHFTILELSFFTGKTFCNIFGTLDPDIRIFIDSESGTPRLELVRDKNEFAIKSIFKNKIIRSVDQYEEITDLIIDNFYDLILSSGPLPIEIVKVSMDN